MLYSPERKSKHTTCLTDKADELEQTVKDTSLAQQSETPCESKVASKVATDTSPIVESACNDIFLENQPFTLNDNLIPKAGIKGYYDSSKNKKYDTSPKDFSNWKFEMFNDAVEACGGITPEIELFSDATNNILRKSHGYTKESDAFARVWTHKYFYGNPDYNDEFITQTLVKALWDYSLAPFIPNLCLLYPIGNQRPGTLF